MRAIDADELKEKIMGVNSFADLLPAERYIINKINRMPTIQPEQHTGNWIKITNTLYKCNRCGAVQLKGNYCKDCGAKMKGANNADTRKFNELISYFNCKVAEMDIDTKYKMELLGMVTALGFAHEKEVTAQPEQQKKILYRHYKGGIYELICNDVKHTETGESLVVYRSCRNPLWTWARPESMFYGLVNVGDELVPRFVLCRSEGDVDA